MFASLPNEAPLCLTVDSCGGSLSGSLKIFPQRGNYVSGKARRPLVWGNTQDLHDEIRSYSALAGDPAAHFADSVCACASRRFKLTFDDDQGVAVRRCVSCDADHAIGDSAEFLEEANLDEAQCPCGAEELEISVGVSLYGDSDAVRWLYLGCRCPKCGLVAVYGDWKNEFEDYRALLAMV